MFVYFHLQSLVAAGLGSGLTEGVLITPFERVKVHIQAQRNRMAEVSTAILCTCTSNVSSNNISFLFVT